MNTKILVAAALEARALAYAPYSHFSVGAALLTSDGRIFKGCNVENLSYGLTLCAERSALAAAVSAGCLAFDTIAIVADTDSPISPCGACRQVLAEFSPSLKIICANLTGAQETFSLETLLPRAKTGILNTP